MEQQKQKRLKNDPRVTRIGKLMRKTSVDEMPQFFNVPLAICLWLDRVLICGRKICLTRQN
jgi:hypothetical protein